MLHEPTLSSSREFGRAGGKYTASVAFLLADNLCLRAEQMAGNLAITGRENGVRAATWKAELLPAASSPILRIFSSFPPHSPAPHTLLDFNVKGSSP